MEQKVLSVEKSSSNHLNIQHEKKIQFEDEIGLILIFIIIAPHRFFDRITSQRDIRFEIGTRGGMVAVGC
jgi:hypothetical protein